jgi:hypothetical protein
METLDCREAAAEYFANILMQAYEAVTLDEIQSAFDVELGDAMAILYEMGTASASVFWDDEDDCECEDELAHVQENDPDPTFAYGDDYTPCSDTDGHWLCTRLADHVGQHIAGDGVTVCGVWDD